MQESAQFAAAIEILEQVESSSAAADRLAAQWLQTRRFVGAKDRNRIRAHLYAILRSRGLLQWQADAAALSSTTNARRLAIAYAAGRHRLDWFGQGEHACASLSAAERDSSVRLPDAAGAPDWARFNMPDFLLETLRVRFGARLELELASLAGEAPVDLRVNIAHLSREQARAQLARDGIESAPTPISPLGLRLTQRRPLTGHPLFKSGGLEIQDEGAQLVAVLLDFAPGQSILDYCAGAGGKALAIASLLGDKGRVIATDPDGARLARLAPRAERAQARALEILPFEKLSELEADCVLVDAPCSNVGAWRRRPEERWRLTPARLAELVGTQAAILDAAARHVRPGGTLAYVTCSLLPAENESQAENFLSRRRDFTQRDARDLWHKRLGVPGPGEGPGLLLTPASTGTDGFFFAMFERS